MSLKIVCDANVRRYYGDNAALLEKYAQTVQGGKCPFCHPNIENKPVAETCHLRVVHNQFPYKLTRLHLLVLPKRHIASLLEMNGSEWADMDMALRNVIALYPFVRDGYGLAVRDGEIGGVTLWHLHWHIIVPSVGQGGQIPVNFGIG